MAWGSDTSSVCWSEPPPEGSLGRGPPAVLLPAGLARTQCSPGPRGPPASLQGVLVGPPDATPAAPAVGPFHPALLSEVGWGGLRARVTGPPTAGEAGLKQRAGCLQTPALGCAGCGVAELSSSVSCAWAATGSREPDHRQTCPCSCLPPVRRV